MGKRVFTFFNILVMAFLLNCIHVECDNDNDNDDNDNEEYYDDDAKDEDDDAKDEDDDAKDEDNDEEYYYVDDASVEHEYKDEDNESEANLEGDDYDYDYYYDDDDNNPNPHNDGNVGDADADGYSGGVEDYVETNKDKRSAVTTDAQLVDSLDKFALQMYSILANKYQQKIITLSPLSVHLCATIALLGAANDTLTVLKNGLGFNAELDAVSATYKKLLKKLTQQNNVQIATKIYVRRGQRGRKTFFKNVLKNFQAKSVIFDFAAGTGGANIINTWVAKQTNKLLKDFLPYDALYSTSRLILLNTIYFKTNWDFKIGNSVLNKCQTNTSDPIKGSFLYSKLPDNETIALPHKQSDIIHLSMKATGDLIQTESKLKTKTIKEIVKGLERTNTTWDMVAKARSTHVELADVFKQLGMDQLFTNETKFSNMLKSRKNIKIARIVHKAFHNLNNDGTEAAAATAIEFHSRCHREFSVTTDNLCGKPQFYTYAIQNDGDEFVPLLMGRDV